MISEFFKKISIFWALPFSIKKKIASYYLHRLTFTQASNSEIIWTSFFYFALNKPVRINEQADGYIVSLNYFNRDMKLLVRKGESSDIYVFFQVFIRDEYFPFFSKLEMLGGFTGSCLDAGANVGYFALAMLCRFPACKVFSVEPDHDNYRTLQGNIDRNNFSGVIVPIHAAIWTENRRLFLIKNSVEEWAYAVSVNMTSDGECDALTLSTILNNYSGNGFDVIKIDVEGAEQQLFCDTDFLHGIQLAKIIGLEIHDDKANREKIQDSLRELGYIISNQGELTLAVKNTK
jgi:FkbM family methyltransferase